MTTMIDTNGNKHQIHAVGNVATLQTIGWKVKADPVDGVIFTLPITPETEQQWDAIFGRR